MVWEDTGSWFRRRWGERTIEGRESHPFDDDVAVAAAKLVPSRINRIRDVVNRAFKKCIIRTITHLESAFLTGKRHHASSRCIIKGSDIRI